MSIEELLERHLNSGQPAEDNDIDPDALLMEMFLLCRKFERCSDKSVMIKCMRPDGSLLFMHKSRPRISPRIIKTTPQTDVESEESDVEREEDDRKDTYELKTRVRRNCLKQAQQDLGMQDLKNIPWRRLLAIGWPEDINFHLDTPPLRKDELEELDKLFHRNAIRFFWK